MELFIEKEFLDNFYKEFKGQAIQNIVKSIFEAYGSKSIFMDITIDSMGDLEKLKKENEFFALICSNDKTPIPVISIKEHLIEKSNFEQTLVFMNDSKDWFEDAENKGALCFSFDDYEERIKTIREKLHFKIDLSEDFKGWNFLSKYKNLNYNLITITDGYILAGRNNQEINSDLIQILELFIKNSNKDIKINILTKELNPLTNKEAHKKEKAKKRFKKLNKKFSFENENSIFSIIMYDVENNYDFHDRIIQTNFSLLDCGKGFNLKHSKNSNSQIISETIFDKYTYNRLLNHQNMQTEYLTNLRNIDTLRFKIYPEM